MTPDLDSMLRRRPAPAMPGALGLTPFASPSFAGPRLTPPPGFTPPAAFQSAGFTAPTLNSSIAAAGPGADMSMRPDGTGAPLQVGAAVTDKGVPGLYESVRTTPRLNDPLAGSAGVTPSRFTLVQTNPIAARGPQASTGAAMRGTATMQALAQIMASGGQPGAAEQPGGPIAARGYNVPEGATAAQQAGFLAEQNRLDLATKDEIARLMPSMPRAGQPAEVRANNQRYVDKLLREQGGADPQELARQYQQTMQASRDPRLVMMGMDAAGNPIQGTVDRNGNFSRITPEKKRGGAGQPERSEDGLFYRSGPDDKWEPLPRSGSETPEEIGARVAREMGLNLDQAPGAGRAAAKTGAKTQSQEVPDGAVALLRQNPSKAAAFDAKYGAGASQRYLAK